jgi:ABC-type sulfate/molybdate transport systems ATPase subunit
VLLLDEPFSHIDNFRKNSLRRKLFNYLKEKNITTIIATHDSTDVLSFADEVQIVHKGEIVESGTPEFIYNNPADKYVASLFGDVNEIEVDGTKHFFYPHQLMIVEISDWKAEVMQSYYRGNYYLIEAMLNGQKVLFENIEVIIKGMEVYLSKK